MTFILPVIALVAFMFAVHTNDAAETPKECKPGKILTYGKCPNVCGPFTPEKWDECASLLQFGCAMTPCPTKPGFFKCQLDPKKITGTSICPGDKVIFDNINMNDNFKVKYSIDLNVAPLKTDIYLLSDTTGSMAQRRIIKYESWRVQK